MSSTEEREVAELVVLVDDNLWNLRAMSRTLTEVGMRVLEHSSVTPALAAALTRRADVVIVDHALVERAGLAFAERVRSAWGPDAPALVAMTRSPDDPAPGGYDAILTKPVGVSGLLDAIDEALALRDERRVHAPAPRRRATGGE